jgi:hypothetical protein
LAYRDKLISDPQICYQLGIYFQGRGGERLDGGQAAGSELFGGEQGRGIGADVLHRLTHLLELEDPFQELDR